MNALRTQVYLTREQRNRLDARSGREGKTLAALIREAVDEYLVDEAGQARTALEETFGKLPALEVPPREEWDRAVG